MSYTFSGFGDNTHRYTDRVEVVATDLYLHIFPYIRAKPVEIYTLANPNPWNECIIYIICIV